MTHRSIPACSDNPINTHFKINSDSDPDLDPYSRIFQIRIRIHIKKNLKKWKNISHSSFAFKAREKPCYFKFQPVLANSLESGSVFRVYTGFGSSVVVNKFGFRNTAEQVSSFWLKKTMEAYRFFCYCIVYALKFVSCLILLLNIFFIVYKKWNSGGSIVFFMW